MGNNISNGHLQFAAVATKDHNNIYNPTQNFNQESHSEFKLINQNSELNPSLLR